MCRLRHSWPERMQPIWIAGKRGDARTRSREHDEGSTEMKRVAAAAIMAVLSISDSISAQRDGRPPSPAGVSATQVGGTYVTVPGIADPQYQGGKWIEIIYSRPIKRGRDLWGSDADYGKRLNFGAPVWRAGADVSTRLKTEVPLII